MFTPEKVKVSPSSSRRGPDLITHKPELAVIQSLHTLTNYTILAQRTAKKASLIVRQDIFRLECLSTNCLAFGCPEILLRSKQPFSCCLSLSLALSKGIRSCARPGDKGGHGGGGGGGDEQQEGQHGHHNTPQLRHHDINR